MNNRKTKDIYIICGYFGYGWESVAEYEAEEKKQAIEDLKEYRSSNTGPYKIIKKRIKKEGF